MTDEYSDQKSWGIIRYAPGSGIACDEDAAGFDGWYSEREVALAIAKDWAARFDGWIVSLVQSQWTRFGDGNFSSIKSYPLTEREKGFAAEKNQ